MDRLHDEHDDELGAVAELLSRERPTLTFDEIARVDHRLSRSRAARRAPRGRSQFVVAMCLAFGLIFMTAGTGLAISGFAAPGAADRAQYPDSAASIASRTTRPSSSTQRAPAITTGRAAGSPGVTAPRDPRKGRTAAPSALSQIPPGAPAATVEVALRRAETRTDLPFTGFDAMPILLAGIALIVTGAVVNRRTRGI